MGRSYMTLTVTVAQLLQNLHTSPDFWNHNAEFGQCLVHFGNHQTYIVQCRFYLRGHRCQGTHEDSHQNQMCDDQSTDTYKTSEITSRDGHITRQKYLLTVYFHFTQKRIHLYNHICFIYASPPKMLYTFQYSKLNGAYKNYCMLYIVCL